MKPQVYLTTTLPYVNADPHIGFALELVTADILARYYRSQNFNVKFNTGTDEHGQKVWQKAIELNIPPQQYVDQSSSVFEKLNDLLNISNTDFTRTTDQHHIKAAQKFWEICAKNGYIYKKNYQLMYCVGCELEKQKSELVSNCCPLHPNLALELREEENYFFRFSAFQTTLLNHYQDHPEFITPASKQNEIHNLVKQGLDDFSISRLKSKMPWGISVPNDNDHVMYVWFDALVNYISAIGWPQDPKSFNEWWPVIQIAGKDNLRQQAAMWQAMLFAAKLPASRNILINGFISVEGQKMSKSLGNVISPQILVDRFGIDATRFLLINLGPIGEDMDVSMSRFDTEYTSWLVNGLGNLFSRIAKLCSNHSMTWDSASKSVEISTEFATAIEQFEFSSCIHWLHHHIQSLDKFLSSTKPWTLADNGQIDVLQQAVHQLLTLAHHFSLIMPDSSQTIINHFKQPNVSPAKPLFPRLKNK